MITTDRIWISGACGRLGAQLNRLPDCRGFELLSTDVEDVDITDASEVAMFADRNHPDTIANCADTTGMEACEANREQAVRNDATASRHTLCCSNGY